MKTKVPQPTQIIDGVCPIRSLFSVKTKKHFSQSLNDWKMTKARSVDWDVLSFELETDRCRLSISISLYKL